MRNKSILIFVLILIVSSLVYADFQEPSSTQGEDVNQWWGEIVEICYGGYSLDPYLVAGLVKKESWFIASAENLGEKNAYLAGHRDWYENYWGKGLTQVTGPWIAGVPRPRLENWEYNMPREAILEEAPVMNDPFNGRENLGRGCWYLSVLIEHYNNDEYSAVTAYNKGFFGVDRGDYNIRNNDYVNDVMRYRDLYLATVENNGQQTGNQSQSGNTSSPSNPIGNITIPFIPDVNITPIENNSSDGIYPPNRTIEISPVQNNTNEQPENQSDINPTQQNLPNYNNDFDNDKREYGPSGKSKSRELSSVTSFSVFENNNYQENSVNPQNNAIEIDSIQSYKDLTLNKDNFNYSAIYVISGILIFVLFISIILQIRR